MITHTKLSFFILLFGVIAGLGLRINAISRKSTLTHDESISYLSATGHQEEFARTISKKIKPYGQWSTASEWKKFILPEKRFCFNKIGSDLAHYDIHPPLYFWLLHLWSLLFGVHLCAGPSLNLLFVLITTFFLFSLAKIIFQDSKPALAVTLLWLLSPSVMEVSIHARQYDLFALVTVILFYQMIKYIHKGGIFRLIDYLAITLSVTAGLLTHYQFSLVIISCYFLPFIELLKTNKKRLTMLILSILTGYILFIIFHPHFLHSITTQHSWVQPFQLGEIPIRFKSILETYCQFFWRGQPITNLFAFVRIKHLFILFMSITCLTIYFVIKKKIQFSVFSRKQKPIVYYVFTSFILLNLFIGSYYILCLAPRHAMRAKYLSMVWPFFSFILVYILQFIKRYNYHFIFSLCLFQFIAGSRHMVLTKTAIERKMDPTTFFHSADKILIDNPARGVLPRIIWKIPETKPVFVAHQKYLLDHPQDWMDKLSVQSVYISYFADVYYSNSREKHDKIINILSEKYQTNLISVGSIGRNYTLF